jgi:alpha-L-rhamnosidase
MKKIFIPVYFLIFFPGILSAVITPGSLKCENLRNPLAVDVMNPRLSWINTAGENERGQVQTAWEIRVAASRENLLKGKADLWNSGRIISGESVNIVYDGKPLGSLQECWWQVRVWDRNGKGSEWSEPASWHMGLLKTDDWKAEWIGAPWQGESPLERPRSPKRPGQLVIPGQSPAAELPPPAPMLRKSLRIERKVSDAKAYVTGLGFFEFYVNGKKAGDDVLIPNVTLYGKRDDIGDIGVMTGNNFGEYRVMYMTYDIKDLLVEGENVLGAILGNGFYNPASYWTEGYGSPRFLGQVYIKYTDGTESVIRSDDSWKAARSPVIMDLVYDGEHYDARLEQSGWNAPGFDDSAWEKAAVKKAPEGIMKAHMSPTDKVMESLAPKKIEQLGEGHYKVDFGEEISGWVHIKNIKGESGRKIDIKYLCESHVGGNSYTMKGSASESYSARFTWFVFREVEIINWPGDLRPEQLSAEAVYSDVETTGKFECSNPLFNTINRIWWRSQTDNMHGGIASDCPHRERSPYTGDGQVAMVTVMHNFDSKTFYTKWIRDILGSQNPSNGYVPNGAPWQPGCGGGVAWGAAMNIMPWEYYLHYGDINLLKENYEGMKGYIKYMLTWTDNDGIMFSQAPDKDKPNRWINLGDWVAPEKLPQDEMVHTFYLWRCSDLTARAAKALGEVKDELYYNELSEKIRSAFMRKYFDNENGTYGRYGGNIFALKMGVPEDQKDRVIKALKNDIIKAGYHIDTGIFGTQFFFEILSENGMHDIAYRVMNQRTQPSYGWWIEQGATTTWEKWDGEGSRNHPMFGGGIVWFYRKLAGMNADQDNPGYRHIIFRPEPHNEISYASYSNITPYGPAGIHWKKDGAIFSAEIRIPVGSVATVSVPASKPEDVTFGDVNKKQNKLVKFLKMDKGYAVFSVRSGNYNFRSTMP